MFYNDFNIILNKKDALCYGYKKGNLISELS
jgi:hypothetical protein